ncbi:MAG TPA: gliding motility-associated C-terminal domain-containing protein [Flavisolibacter sp.]|nr:gliding motility-associated C-terminal domain-containing protein [Flavisolibacter sp.]
MKLTALLSLLLLSYGAFSQNPSSVFSRFNKEIKIACGASCTTITATVPDIRQSDDYIVTAIPYLPYAYATPNGNELVPLYDDDVFSSKISLPFTFCFYGINYNKLVVGSNSIISFDTTNAGCDNAFTVSPPIPYASGTQCFQFSTYYPRASIFGPYHDIDPKKQTPGKKIEWRVEGTAPNRRFIASYNDVALFSCNNRSATHQMVIYEATGIVEVYLESKPFCNEWNNGKSILGIQNFNRNKAVSAPGKNATQWGSANMNEAYRFLPTAGASKFKRAELISKGNIISLADTTSSNGELNLSFPNICLAEETETYVMKVYYSSCDAPSDEVSFSDTITIRKSSPAITINTENAVCTGGGKIIVNAVDLQTPIVYSINGGAFQDSNTFSNLPAGNFTVVAKDAGGCTVSATSIVPLTNNLILQIIADTTVCQKSQFSGRVISNATSFSWSPSTGLSSNNIQNPIITANQSTTYSITATLGSCTATKSFRITVLPVPFVSAGGSQTILEGDRVQLQATASEGVYLWSPPAGLSSTNILNPVASPSQTTTYSITVTNSVGCTATDALTITVLPYCVQPKEAFTPNGDGLNDVWFITNGNCLKMAKVEVFNRYGSKVYENADYKNNWNGTYQGKPLPDGTYYFVIQYELINSTKVIKKGNVTIIR